MYRQAYRRKLTTPEQAVEPIKDSATIVHGMASGEPPALLAAIAHRVRQGDLKDLHIFSLSWPWPTPPPPSCLPTWRA